MLSALCFFGRLYQVVRLLTVGDIFDRFQLGILGVLGSLLFLFSANFGMMDSLADDGSKEYVKYRIIPLAAPAAAFAQAFKTDSRVYAHRHFCFSFCF